MWIILRQFETRNYLAWTLAPNVYWIFMLTFTGMFVGNVCYRRINPSKTPGWSACCYGDADVRNLESAQCRMHIDQFVSALRVVQVPVLVFLRSSCKHMTEGGGPYVLWGLHWNLSWKWRRFVGCIPPLPKHVIYYVSIQFCIIEDLVRVSTGEPLLLTEVAVRTWWRREDNIKVLLRKNEFRVDSNGLRWHFTFR